MLAKLEIVLETKEKLNLGISSLMQGVLMEYIDNGYGAILHESTLKPYTQHVEFAEKKIHWVITTLTDEAKKKIIDRIIASNKTTIEIKHKNMVLRILSKELSVLSYDELLERTYFADCKPYITMQFITPSAFKVNGKYQFYPTPFMIIQSIIKKHDNCESNTELGSEDFMRTVQEEIEITRYKLKSTAFHLEGVRIPSFVGFITLRVHGSQQFINLINLLAEYGEYSGVGIKTAIGMGSVRVIRNKQLAKEER